MLFCGERLIRALGVSQPLVGNQNFPPDPVASPLFPAASPLAPCRQSARPSLFPSPPLSLRSPFPPHLGLSQLDLASCQPSVVWAEICHAFTLLMPLRLRFSPPRSGSLPASLPSLFTAPVPQETSSTPGRPPGSPVLLNLSLTGKSL